MVYNLYNMQQQGPRGTAIACRVSSHSTRIAVFSRTLVMEGAIIHNPFTALISLWRSIISLRGEPF